METALGTDIGLVAKLLRGFVDPTRLAILVALSDGEQRVTDLVARLGGSQGNISGHLACLKDCGMVTDRPQGRAVWYSIAEPEVIAVIRARPGPARSHRPTSGPLPQLPGPRRRPAVTAEHHPTDGASFWDTSDAEPGRRSSRAHASQAVPNTDSMRSRPWRGRPASVPPGGVTDHPG